MAKVYHDLVVNVETGAYTVKPVLDIHQGDSNTHVLLVKLRDSKNNFVSISETSKANIKFFYDDTLIMSSAVEVVNAYRGVLQYLIGPALVKNSGRYTVYLDISQCECDCVCGPTVSFTMTVSKCHDQGFNDSDIEVTITKEQLNEIMAHLANAEIHLDEFDREFLNTFEPLKDDLERVVESLTPDKVLKTAFTTVDFRDQMTALTRENVVEGKIVRVNYPDYDGDPSTVNEDWYNPKYYACHLLGNDETIEWVVMDFTDGVSPRLRKLEEKVAGIDYEVSHEVVHTTDDDEKILSVDGTEIKSTLTIDTYRDQADDTVYISLKGIDGEEISRIDASQFVKDGMLDSVSYDPETHILTLVFNTDAGKETIHIDISMEFEAIQEELDKKVDKGTESSLDGVSVGKTSEATGTSSLAAGHNAKATKVGSVALGPGTNASGTRSIAIGQNSKAEGAGSIAIGEGAQAKKDGSIQIGFGTNDTANTLQILTRTYIDITSGKILTERLNMDSALSGSSENPVQNKVVKNALDLKLSLDGADTMTGPLRMGGNNILNPGYISNVDYMTLASGGYILGVDGTAYVAGLRDPVQENEAANKGYVDTQDALNEKLANKVTSITDQATNDQYASALAVKNYTDTAISSLPIPMQFKGTVGDSGTVEWNTLPQPSASNEGFTYKVITDHATAPICNEGDTIVSNGSAWVVIPSGDEPSGTVTNIATGDGLTGGPITSSGTIAHLDTDGYKHLPSGGSSGKFVKWSASGTGQWDDVTKSDVGLGNVDNTSDLDKPVSTATQNYISQVFNQGLDPSYVPVEPLSVATKEYVDGIAAQWSPIGGNA